MSEREVAQKVARLLTRPDLLQHSDWRKAQIWTQLIGRTDTARIIEDACNYRFGRYPGESLVDRFLEQAQAAFEREPIVWVGLRKYWHFGIWQNLTGGDYEVAGKQVFTKMQRLANDHHLSLTDVAMGQDPKHRWHVEIGNY